MSFRNLNIIIISTILLVIIALERTTDSMNTLQLAELFNKYYNIQTLFVAICLAGCFIMVVLTANHMRNDLTTLNILFGGISSLLLFVTPAIIASLTTLPIDQKIYKSDYTSIQDRWLTTDIITQSKTFQKIDGNTFIINGHTYQVSDTSNVKTIYTDNQQDPGIKIYQTQLNDHIMPKQYRNYLDKTADTNVLPSHNPTKYTKIVITQHID